MIISCFAILRFKTKFLLYIESVRHSNSSRMRQPNGVKKKPFGFGTRNRNRTCNYPLGGGYYIHLTMQAYSLILTQLFGLCKGIFVGGFAFSFGKYEQIVNNRVFLTNLSKIWKFCSIYDIMRVADCGMATTAPKSI